MNRLAVGCTVFLGCTLSQLRLATVRADQIPSPPRTTTLEVTVDTSKAPDLAEWGARARRLVEEWHPKICEMLASEGFRPPTKVKLLFRNDLDHPAHTSGVRVKVITISARWIREHPDDYGMVIHELTHVVQSYPRYEAGWLVEGIADYVRYIKFERKTRAPRIDPATASYRNGYKTAAYFLRWIEKAYEKELVSKLNRELRTSSYTDALFERYTGKTLDRLWSEYVVTVAKKGTTK